MARSDSQVQNDVTPQTGLWLQYQYRMSYMGGRGQGSCRAWLWLGRSLALPAKEDREGNLW